VFESASAEIEMWNKTASGRIDAQLVERRRAFRRRGEALERIQRAAGDLEQRITELESQAAHLQQLLLQVGAHAEALRTAAPPEVTTQGGPDHSAATGQHAHA
jgi:hypothetical protein